MTLRQILSEHFEAKAPSLLSVDAEGYDAVILESNDWSSYRPTLVMFERSDDEEADDPASELLLKNGYHRLTKLGCNVVFEADEAAKN